MIHIQEQAKPFLHWLGGKRQLLKEIERFYPFSEGSIKSYCEPFVGAGAVLFDILSQHELYHIYISDSNLDLINAYKAIRDECEELTERLSVLQGIFNRLSKEEQEKYYYSNRAKFNSIKLDNNKTNLEKAALLIFLNKTCFNGLYRVNRKGIFNASCGTYKKNKNIIDEDNLKNVSEILKNVEVRCADYRASMEFIDKNTFVYLDPPYRPISRNDNRFYNSMKFTDTDQNELKRFIDSINETGAKFVLSSSDPKNTDKTDNFFDELYKKYIVKRVEASRNIDQSKAARKRVTELIITNISEQNM